MNNVSYLLKQRVLFIPLLLFTLLGCQSFRGSRAPQSAGFGGYCPECLVKNIDKNLAELQSTIQKVDYDPIEKPLPVDEAIMFDEKGKAVCYVDLHKHPELVPNFTKLNKKEFVQNTKSNNRKPASTEEPKLPHCTKEYLAKLKKVVKSNTTFNGKKSHIHKTGLNAPIVNCVTGLVGGAIMNYMLFEDNLLEGLPTSIITTALGGLLRGGVELSGAEEKLTGKLATTNKKLDVARMGVREGVSPVRPLVDITKEVGADEVRLNKLKQNKSLLKQIGTTVICFGTGSALTTVFRSIKISE